MALSADYDPSIVEQSFVGAHLTPEAEEVYNWSFLATHDFMSSQRPRGSEHLLLGFTFSDDALDSLQEHGISEQSFRKSIFAIDQTKEVVVPGTKETVQFRSIYSLAALLAFQEKKAADYKITGRHLVDAVRRTPNSAAYQHLRVLTSDPHF